MVQRKVSYPSLGQFELTTALQDIYVITPGRISLTITFTFCNFTATDRGYDLKLRPTADSPANKHYLRGSKAAAQGKLLAGETEIWQITIRAGDSFTFEAAAEAANAISVTISPAEAQMSNE